MNSKTINSFSARTVDRLISARRAILTMLATFLIAMTAQTAWASTFSGGDGESASTPYLISSIADLNQLAADVNSGTNNYAGKYFLLTTDLTYTKTVANNFTPIGNDSSPFKGIFDGNGKTISGLNINLCEANGVGLFGNTRGATIKGLKLDDSTITGGQYVGGIVGDGGSSSTTVQNCAVTSTVTVSGRNTDVGGIAGKFPNVRGCVSAAAVSGRQNVGGIIGDGCDATIECCLYTGNSVTATAASPYNGAIIGNKNNSSLTANYYTQATIGGCNGSDEDGARKAVVISAAEGVTITPKGDATTIDVNGITFYENNLVNNSKTILGCAGKLYVDATVNIVKLFISYTVSEGYAFTAYSDGNSHVLTDNYDGMYYTLTINNASHTIAAIDVWGMEAGADGTSEATAYTITTPAGLDLLAMKVKEGNDYENKYFKLGEDITYPHDSDWNSDTSWENTYTAIGHSSRYFRGHFNGNSKTISGIRIYTDDYSCRGIFGSIAYPAVVENITLADTRITAVNTVGGIVGINLGGTINNCHVTNTVKLRALNSNSISSCEYGGIVGHNFINETGGSQIGVVSNCISEVTLTSCSAQIGGIAGKNQGSLENNFVIGAIIPATTFKSYGAIVGQNKGTLTNNYYSSCTVGGVVNATNVGVGVVGDTDTFVGDVAENNGAIVDEWGLRDGNDGTATNPYIIKTTGDLDLLAQKVNAGTSYEGKYFKLGDNIAYDKNTGNNFTPIGYVLEKDNGEVNNFPFKGHFDGNGKTISGININNSSARYQGIFGYLKGTVKNLVVSNCSIVTYHNIGAIVGLSEGTIENCHVGSDVTLSGHLNVGGIAGRSIGATIKGCTSAATIKGITNSGSNADNLGGIVGANHISSLTDNLFTGAITGDLGEYIGAIIGDNPKIFDNQNGTPTNNLYTSTGFGGIGAEGSTTGADGAGARKAVVIGAAEGVTITPTGEATTYNVSGITTYADNNVLGYDSKLYAGATDAVKLSIANTGTPETGYEFSGFTAGEGVTITSSENVYTLTVPASDVTVDVVNQAIIYNITYKGVEDEGVTFTEDNPEAYTVADESFALSNPSREGYVFAGWTYEGQTEPTKTVTIAKGSTGDKTFTANWEKLLTNTDITVSTIADQTYTGSEIKPAITVKDGTTDITDQCDFTYNSNKVVGTAEVVISAKESSATYAGEKTVTFKIAPKTVSTPTITLSGTSFEYTGEAIKPTVTVKDGETTIPAEEYTVGYSNNIEDGTATVTITDNEGGNYTVSGTATFTITPKPNTAVVNVEETPVAIGGEVYYKSTEDIYEKMMYKAKDKGISIGLSAKASNRIEVTAEGVKFSKGTSTTMAMLNLKFGDIIKLFFRGIIRFNDDGSIFIVKSLTRGDGDTSSDGMIDLVSGAEYKVLKDGALVLTIVLENEEAVIEGISVTRAGTSTDEPTSIVVTAKNKYWTFSCDQDVKVPEGVKVYTCQLNSKGTKAIITELSATELGGVIKANNGVLLSSDPGDYTFVFSPETTSTAKTYEHNELVAVVKPTHLSPNDYYVLKDNEFHVILDDETEVPANKAVLKKPTGASGSRAIGIDEGDDATRIWGVSVADEDAVWYTVSGQRIDKPTKKGLYIKNGVKVVVK